MNASSQQAAWHEVSGAFNIVLERLYVTARQSGSSRADSSDLESALAAVPPANRGQVILVLESIESRATARADEDLAEVARVIRKAAGQVWAATGLVAPAIAAASA